MTTTRKVWEFLKHFPVTTALLVVLAGVGVVTNTHIEQLSAAWLKKLGFSANDLWLWRVGRLFTSAVVTYGGRVFWETLGMTAFAVGLSEWLSTSRRALATFWGVHLATVISEVWLILWPLYQLGGANEKLLAVERDVGPSAGYFGSLGLACARLPGKWRWLSGGAVMAGLVAVLFIPPWLGETPAMKLLADLAHLMAFPMGWLSSGVGKKAKN